MQFWTKFLVVHLSGIDRIYMGSGRYKSWLKTNEGWKTLRNEWTIVFFKCTEKNLKKLNKRFYQSTDFTEQSICLTIIPWEKERIRWKMNDNYENELIFFFEQFKNPKRNRSFSNDEQTKWKNEGVHLLKPQCFNVFTQHPLKVRLLQYLTYHSCRSVAHLFF